ncbi:hypothetical protein C8R43DRAFT_1236852 [Mycena crocata]|nr:hypothetical protein C8R43DRAFT_1236852 [Mycena crocata]
MPSAALEADRVRVANIDAQLLDLPESIWLLGVQRQVSQGRLDAYKYPVLTLPNEIAFEIFLHFLPPYPRCPPMAGILSPTLLTQICRRWRNITLATPALWRAIGLVGTPEKVEPQKVASESWLSRSGCYPLSIRMDQCSEQLRESVQLLSSHRARWEYLHLAWVVPELLPKFYGATPLLRDLSVRLFGESTIPIRFEEATLLRSVILGHDTFTDIILPWHQLTSLTMYMTSPYECTPILQQTVNLLHCSIFLYPETSEEPEMILPLLESLVLDSATVQYDDEAPTTAYFESFIVPALQGA